MSAVVLEPGHSKSLGECAFCELRYGATLVEGEAACATCSVSRVARIAAVAQKRERREVGHVAEVEVGGFVFEEIAP